MIAATVNRPVPWVRSDPGADCRRNHLISSTSYANDHAVIAPCNRFDSENRSRPGTRKTRRVKAISTHQSRTDRASDAIRITKIRFAVRPPKRIDARAGAGNSSVAKNDAFRPETLINPIREIAAAGRCKATGCCARSRPTPALRSTRRWKPPGKRNHRLLRGADDGQSPCATFSACYFFGMRPPSSRHA